MARWDKRFRNGQKTVLSAGIGTVLCVLLGSFFFSLNAEPSHSSNNKSVDAPPLTCRKIYQIGVWGWKRHGGPSNIDLKSKPFADEFGKVFVDKLDVFHVLWTKEQSESLKKKASAAWGRVVFHSDCEYFDTFFKTEFPQAKRDLFARLEPIKKASLKAAVNPDENASEVEMFGVKFAKFPNWAPDRTALDSRLLSLVKKIDSTYSKSVERAYRGDRQEFTADSLRQLLFSDTLVGRNQIVKTMLGSMDPYSTYYSHSEFEEFYHELTGGTSGIGVKLRKVPNGVYIEKLTKDSPAERSKKIHAGDIIVGIDGVSLDKLSFDEAKQKLKGPELSSVMLEVQNAFDGKKIKLELKRESFSFDDARITTRLVSLKKNSRLQVAVIDIPNFYGRGGMEPANEEHSSAEDLTIEVEKLVKAKQPPSAIILDLRGNPGGYLEEAVTMAGLFIGAKPVVGVLENNALRAMHDDRESALYTGPLFVLQDEESASASEVLAGALKDHQRAVIIGSSHSYGKGSVQRLFHLNDEMLFENELAGDPVNGVVKLTTSTFYSPLGHSPVNGGVESDIALPQDLVPPLTDAPANDLAKKIPETKPFLEDTELKGLEQEKQKGNQRTAKLEERSHVRMENMGSRKSKLASLADEELRQTEKDQAALNEAVAVAADSLEYDRLARTLEARPTAKAE